MLMQSFLLSVVIILIVLESMFHFEISTYDCTVCGGLSTWTAFDCTDNCYYIVAIYFETSSTNAWNPFSFCCPYVTQVSWIRLYSTFFSISLFFWLVNSITLENKFTLWLFATQGKKWNWKLLLSIVHCARTDARLNVFRKGLRRVYVSS